MCTILLKPFGERKMIPHDRFANWNAKLSLENNKRFYIETDNKWIVQRCKTGSIVLE